MPSHAARAHAPRVVAVPVDFALVYDVERGWHYQHAPAPWWLDEQEALLAHDERPQERLSLVPPLTTAYSSCRPGSGPCRRPHEHASTRRAG